MNTTLQRNTAHPPDTQDQQVLQIPAADELRELSLGSRLSFRIGLWLLQHAQRPRRATRAVNGSPFLADRQFTPGENQALLTFDLQRFLR